MLSKLNPEHTLSLLVLHMQLNSLCIQVGKQNVAVKFENVFHNPVFRYLVWFIHRYDEKLI